MNTNDVDNLQILKGNIIFTESPDKFTVIENGYIVVRNGKVDEITDKVKDSVKDKVEDFKDKLIIPSMCDLHLHAPQYKITGMGMDKELIPWLNSYAFPEEAKFSNLDYAKKIFRDFINSIWENGTTHICVFSTLHKKAAKLLIDMLDLSGIHAFVGKVNMDSNSPEYLSETADKSLADTEEVIKYCLDKSSIVRPIITPRFAPSCSEKLMEGLGQLVEKYNLPVQSHLSENMSEIQWVKELFPKSKFYGDVYNHFNMFGQTPTVMAHCVHSSEDEINLMKSNNVMVVHCPISNVNLGSGIMPAREYLNKGIHISLGTDIGAGSSFSVIKNIMYAIQLSKLYWMQSEKSYPFLSTSEAFYMATKSGGSFFGKVGSFEKGYDFNALVIDDSNLNDGIYSVCDRLERFIYLGDEKNIVKRYIDGKAINRPEF